MGEIRRTQLVEEKFSHSTGGDDSLSRVIRKIVGYFRTRQPKAIRKFRRQRHPVVRIRILLDQKSDPELPRNQTVHFVGEVSAEQGGVIVAELAEFLGIYAARVHSIDEIDGRDVGIAAEFEAGNHEVPA